MRDSRILRSIAVGVIALFGVVILTGDFLAPYPYSVQYRSLTSAPPTTIYFRDESGRFHFRPFIYRRELADPLAKTYVEIKSQRFDIVFLPAGEPYRLLGFIPVRIRLFGVGGTAENIPQIHLLGTDQLGRDRFSRLLVATKFSLIVCPIGAMLAWMIGVLVGLVSGFAARWQDRAIMGAADSMLALPTLILILAARAAFPLELPPFRAAILLIFIFALTGWAEIARLTRSLVRALKERDFVIAARSVGLSETRILFRHILPNSLPTLLTQASVILPYFLLSEVALSFLGVGVQEPQPSLGNMLSAAADLNQLRSQPLLLMSPAFVITLFVLAIRILTSKSEKRSHGMVFETK